MEGVEGSRAAFTAKIDAWKGGNERKVARTGHHDPSCTLGLGQKRLDKARLAHAVSNQIRSEKSRERVSGTRVLAPPLSVSSVILIGLKRGRGYLKISQPSPHIFHSQSQIPFSEHFCLFASTRVSPSAKTPSHSSLGLLYFITHHSPSSSHSIPTSLSRSLTAVQCLRGRALMRHCS